MKAKMAQGSDEFATAGKFAVPLVILLYVAVCVVRTLTSKALLVAAPMPIALSALSLGVTCICMVPVFLIYPKHWGIPDFNKNGPGLALVVILLSLDMVFTNSAVALLSVPLQQCILALNPTVTAALESVVRRKLKHPVRAPHTHAQRECSGGETPPSWRHVPPSRRHPPAACPPRFAHRLYT